MTKIHPLSFALGLGTGVLLFVIAFSGLRLLHPATTPARTFGNQQGGQNITRTAERLGMTEAEVQKELDSGKTMRDIMAEHDGLTAGRQQNGSGSVMTGSGTRTTRTSSGITSPTNQ